MVLVYGAEHLKSTAKINLIARIKLIEFTMGNSFCIVLRIQDSRGLAKVP